jgi:hypothetical protein
MPNRDGFLREVLHYIITAGLSRYLSGIRLLEAESGGMGEFKKNKLTVKLLTYPNKKMTLNGEQFLVI